MNCTVNSQILAQELRLLNKIAPAKAALPILSHILISATDKLSFYATDLEMSVLTGCASDVVEPGTVALPAARLLALVEQFLDAPVTLATEGNGVRVTCGIHTSRLQAMPIADFPQPPDIEGEEHTISATGLRGLIACTRYAIDETNVKFVLKGALLDLSPGRAAMVTTDSRRVAIATMPHNGSTASVIIPAKTVDLLAGQLDGADYTMTIGPRHLFFAANGRTLISRMLDTQFPNYQRIIPTNAAHTIVADRIQLAAALRRVGLSAGDENKVYLEFQSGTVDLSARSAEVGNAEERLLVTYDGAPIRICVNWHLLLDTLDAAQQLNVTIQLKDTTSPMLVLDGENHLAVIMTMRDTEVKA